MLVLGRHEGERVVIGDAVVSVNQIMPSRVLLGIDAPHNVRILRDELLTRSAWAALNNTLIPAVTPSKVEVEVFVPSGWKVAAYRNAYPGDCYLLANEVVVCRQHTGMSVMIVEPIRSEVEELAT